MNLVFRIIAGSLALALYCTTMPKPAESPPKSPQEVIEEYTKIGEEGSLLTPAGWSKAQTFFLHSSPQLEDIYVAATYAPQVAWVKGSKAEVDQEYDPIGKN
jgi:hypothetical protein